ncbi:MAG: EamA family transporter [Abditibacteriota bacterium]|nr:EamA family transporter [Abditibacteriota bacterium]
MSEGLTDCLILALAVFMGCAYYVAMKPVNMRVGHESHIPLFNALFSAAGVLLLLAYSLLAKTGLYLPPAGIAAAAGYGIVATLAVYANMKALERGPLSLTSLFAKFSMVLPIAYSFLFLHEQASLFRMTGIVLICVCIVLFADPQRTGREQLTRGWLLMALMLMACNGAVQLIGKIYALSSANAYQNAFLLWAFGFETLAALVIFLCLSRGRSAELARAFVSPAVLELSAFVAAAALSMNFAIVALATRMDGSVFFPIYSGGPLILIALAGRLIFKEEMNTKKVSGILLGIVAIALLNM